ncbi:hypothetical protein C8R48DRAFT_776836 [Suillus tomentosus]|nr:hypothetical protein C8R48DRAFT_776836 [Suillus tomentosus]
MMRVKELAAGPSVDHVACLVVEAYLEVHLGTIAFNNKFYNEAVEIFTAAAKASKFFANLPIHTMYEEFTMHPPQSSVSEDRDLVAGQEDGWESGCGRAVSNLRKFSSGGYRYPYRLSISLSFRDTTAKPIYTVGVGGQFTDGEERVGARTETSYLRFGRRGPLSRGSVITRPHTIVLDWTLFREQRGSVVPMRICDEAGPQVAVAIGQQAFVHYTPSDR